MSEPRTPLRQPSADPPGQEPPRPRTSAWAKVVAILGVATIFSLTFLYVFERVRALPGDALEEGRKMLDGLGRVAEAFYQGTVTTSFIGYATEVHGSSYLQFATLEETEVFRREDRATALWGTLELPEVVVEATAPVETTYYVDLDGRWDFEAEGRRIFVVAPPIRFNKPAVDASKIRYEVRSDSLLRDETEAIERLREGITHLSMRRAKDNIPLVRETGRREIERFVEVWLAERFVDGGDYVVDVVFRDELDARDPRRGTPILLPPGERSARPSAPDG